MQIRWSHDIRNYLQYDSEGDPFVSNSKCEHQNLPLRNAQNHSVVHFPTATVKPVYKDRPKDQQNVVTLDRWSL